MNPPEVLYEGPGRYRIRTDVRLGETCQRVECLHREPDGWTVDVFAGPDWVECRLMRHGETQAIHRQAL